MANYATLKAAVADVVKTNGTQAITGANLQTVLLSIINSVGGGGYIFAGVATPSTDAGTPDQNVFYIGGAGTYANFGSSYTVPVGSIGVFKYNGSWAKETITMFAGIDDVPNYDSSNLISSGAVFNSKIETEKKLAGSDIADFSKTPYTALNNAGAVVTNSAYDLYTIKNDGYKSIYVKSACASVNYNSISFYSGNSAGDGYISGVPAVMITSGVEEITEYYAEIPVTCNIIAVANYKNGTLTTPDVFVTKDYESLQTQINEKCDLAEQAITSTDWLKTSNRYINLSGGIGAIGTFDIYKVFLDNVEKAYIKVGGNATNYINMVAFFSDYKITDNSSDSFISSSAILNNIGTHEYMVDVPSNAKVLIVSNCKAELSEPVIKLYYGTGIIKDELNEFKEKINNSFKVNPRKNLYNSACIIDDYIATASGQTWSITKELGAKMAIVRVDDYDGNLNINNLEAVRYLRAVIFLDKDKNPAPNGGSYVVNNTIKITGSNWLYRGEKYIAFTLYRQDDINNVNASYGYVWTDEEIKQGFPNWINDVSVNFVPSTNTLPNFVIKDCEIITDGSSFDISTNILNLEAINILSEKLLSSNVNNYFNLFFSTDSHIDFNSASDRNVQNMVGLASDAAMLPYLDCVIQNGDVATPTYLNNKEQAMNVYNIYYDTIKKSSVPFIQVSGNHDRHQETRTQYTDALTYAECVDYLKNYSLHTANTLYDYQDFPTKKVRIIKLDGFEYPLESVQKEYSGVTETVVKYPLTGYDCIVSQTQMQWLANTLLSTPNDYTIIVTGHIYKDNPIIGYITEVLNAAVHKQSGSTTFDYSYMVAPSGYSGFPYGTFIFTYDFTLCNDIKIAAMMCGHDHRDSYELINGINVINTACQLMEDTAGNQLHRAAYSKYQNCYNVINLDLANNKLNLYRYGWGSPNGTPYNGVTEFDY